MKKVPNFLILCAFFTVFSISATQAQGVYHPRDEKISKALDGAEYLYSHNRASEIKRDIAVQQAMDEMPFKPTKKPVNVLPRQYEPPQEPVIQQEHPVETNTAEAKAQNEQEVAAIKTPVVPQQKPLSEEGPKKKRDPFSEKYLDFNDPSNSLELSTEVASYTMSEDNSKKADTMLYGVSAKYKHQFSKPPTASFKEFFTGKVPANSASLDVELIGNPSFDYKSERSTKTWSDGIAKWDIRTRLNFDFLTKSNQFVSPYSGLGYTRYDDTMYIIDPLGAVDENTMYERTQELWYMPIGFNIIHQSANKWKLALNLEYDFLMFGKNKSYLNATGQYSVDADYVQRAGHGGGYRGSFQILREFNKFDLFLEPFFRIWNVDKSDSTPWVASGGATTGDTNMASFTTHEYGARLGVKF